MADLTRAFALASSLLIVGDAVGAPASSTSSALEFLQEGLGLSDEERARLAAGQAVTRMVDDPGFREIAVLAAVKLPAPPSDWSADYAGLERLRRVSPDFIGMGRLGNPPSPEELAAVELEARIAAALGRCHVARCPMNASRADIERYRAVGGEAGDARGSANAVFRQVLLERLAAYQQAGDAALPIFANRRFTLTTSDAPALLLDRRPSLRQLAPRLDARLRACADGRPAEGDVFYWLREKMWRREVVGLHHAVFDEERTADGRRSVIAEKLVYANQYLLGALTVTGVVEDGTGAYLFFLNRSETDNRDAFNFIERALANRLIGGRLKRQVPGLRDRVVGAPALNARSER